MPIGTCRLCLTPGVELRDSHFVPRALYKLFRERGSNSEPVMSSATKSLLSEKQAHDYLLCDECEDRFNKRGEKWFLQNAWRDPDDFPLRTRLVDAGPSTFSSPDLTMFETASVPGVDREKLVYFGVSVFWRAAVHRWRLPSGPSEPIALGPYENQFRRYLLGNAEFPRDALILTTVSYSTEEMRNKFVTFPWLYKRDGMCRQFKMIVTGVTFQLFTGKVMLPGLRDLCTVRSEQGFVFMANRTDLINIDNNISMLKTSRRMGKLAKAGGVLLSDGVTTR